MVGYVMILSPQHQSWLFFLPLAQQSALLKDDLRAERTRSREKTSIRGRHPRCSSKVSLVLARGRLSKKRAEKQKRSWFRRALHWRAGCEATISTLKHSFSMLRATYKGERGFERYMGCSVITKNLFSIARWQERRKRRRNAQGDGILGPTTQAAEGD